MHSKVLRPSETGRFRTKHSVRTCWAFAGRSAAAGSARAGAPPFVRRAAAADAALADTGKMLWAGDGGGGGGGGDTLCARCWHAAPSSGGARGSPGRESGCGWRVLGRAAPRWRARRGRGARRARGRPAARSAARDGRRRRRPAAAARRAATCVWRCSGERRAAGSDHVLERAFPGGVGGYDAASSRRRGVAPRRRKRCACS